ncbi:NAD-dependent epimerase/dehydratase family protein [Oleiagrimonas soli]|uniref:Nucleoside-diphosphate sugar epimerase n=1 Tax=Oleiagrimonas soli TaxID=1543381 RepID=A0A099CZT2_9GAMM|nr:NAD-dependent epimerase/dehydratase family protein [Oleiagrimonas soli]KGI79082.1 nucleoside-diphosphate sugar epimerase [Oleiagrimonas soli]MBB6184710.1 UDP-glucose 4-epimerase [Oleiagrimonas soli]
MHVLITGGAGFIGSHVAQLHLARGDKVHVVDDLSTGNRANIHLLEGFPNFRFDHADMLVWDGLERAAAWADRIYHLAAVVGVYRVIAEPTRVLATNIAACERLLRAVTASGWKPHVVIASSSEVYGHRLESELHEQMDLSVSTRAGTRWNYSVSKIADEALGLSYAQKFDIPTVIARLFNTTGPRQTGRYGMVVPRFVEQAVKGEEITVYGDGVQTRSFCDVRDTARALDMLAAKATAEGLVVNVGNDREISVNDLAEMVRARAHSTSPIKHVPYVTAYGEDFEDIRRRRPVLDRLRALTGFKHEHTLEDTLDELIRTSRAKLSKEDGHGHRSVVCHQS